MSVKLTQFSPGAGCGCKISPKDLEEILKNSRSCTPFENLIVGNSSKDDAAVYDIGDGKSIISTTDFFTPIVDDPFLFGKIAATNAISDIYAMGGKPIMAIAILGWPLDKLGADVAGIVIDGAKEVCEKAGIPLAGGHSINISEPIFGLAVTGIIETAKVKRNDTATEGCQLFISKPIGIGLVTTAEKFGLAREQDKKLAVELMSSLNTIGQELAQIDQIKAMTDITGFGLLGHTIEIAQGSSLTANIHFNKIPLIDGCDYYIQKECIPGGTSRNYNSYGHLANEISNYQKAILCDPQTSGGILIAVEPQGIDMVMEVAKKNSIVFSHIGELTAKNDQFFAKVI